MVNDCLIFRQAGLSRPTRKNIPAPSHWRLPTSLSAKPSVQPLIDAYQVGVIDLDDLKQRRDRVADHGRALRERLGEIQR